MISNVSGRAELKKEAEEGLERALRERTAYIRMMSESSNEERAFKNELIAEVNARITRFIQIIHG